MLFRVKIRCNCKYAKMNVLLVDSSGESYRIKVFALLDLLFTSYTSSEKYIYCMFAKKRINRAAMSIKTVFDSFSKNNVLIIGDVMLDSYLWGKVSRISPEAPVPIVSVTNQEDRLGGAANVALNLRSLGATAIICSVIGNDEKGKTFFSLMEKHKLTDEAIIVAKDRKTSTKTRVIAGSQHVLRVDDEVTTALNEHVEQLLLSKILYTIDSKTISAIIFEDYDKGVITPKIIEQVTRKANEKNIPVAVDPKKRNFMDYKSVTLFKPNFLELTEGMKIDIAKNDYTAIYRAALDLIQTNDIRYVMVTLSELGVVICDKDQYHHIPAQIRQISDVSGAGDTVVSVASLCLAAGMKPYDIARISNIAGGLVCEIAGVVPVDKQRLLQEAIK